MSENLVFSVALYFKKFQSYDDLLSGDASVNDLPRVIKPASSDPINKYGSFHFPQPSKPTKEVTAP